MKITPEPPRVAIKTRPSSQPAQNWRCRVPEPGNGWVTRPHLEPHGLDGHDAMDGFLVDKTGVWRRDKEQLLTGTPYHHNASVQVNKEQVGGG